MTLSESSLFTVLTFTFSAPSYLDIGTVFEVYFKIGQTLVAYFQSWAWVGMEAKLFISFFLFKIMQALLHTGGGEVRRESMQR
jgi:hypothetical protein